jgi:predicted dehydrogenase
MAPFEYAIVGAGWRTEFFLRINAALPERFRTLGLVVRNPEKAEAFERKWGYPTYRDVSSLLHRHSPEFIVGSVSYAANFAVNLELIDTGLPLLTETPPAATLEEMRTLWQAAKKANARVQVCEQFHRQPLHAARLAAIRDGLMGPVHTAYLSVCHGYHGTSLIRRFLGVDCERARICGMGWTDRVLDPGSRAGRPAAPEVKAVPQQMAMLEFDGGRQAVFDFVGVQYFSHIRRQRVAIRGELGEIVDHTLYTHSRGLDPVALPFHRQEAGPNGNLEGQHLKGIQLGERWVYRNPTAPARLSDEEIAMAGMLQGMGEYVRGGPEVYSLREGMQDHYLGLKVREACESGLPVSADPEVWA